MPALDMALVYVRAPGCSALAGIYAADVSVSRLILRLRDRNCEAGVFALYRPMYVILFHAITVAH